MKYADVSEANLFHGNMRFDVNVSVSKTDELGTRTETKNLNSFRSVEKAAEYEINRQIELLEKGTLIQQETRGWDDAKQRTSSQRGKEQAHDYRYMPDPDLPPVILSDEYIEGIKATIPTLPNEWRERLSSLGLDASQSAVLIEAEVDSEAVGYLDVLESALSDQAYAKQLANWFVNIEIPLRNDEKAVIELPVDDRNKLYSEVHALVQESLLSSSNAKALITDIFSHSNLPNDIRGYADQQGMMQVSDTSAIEAIVTEVLSANPQAAEDVKKGEMKAIGFLVGQVMKASRGTANPGLAQELIRKKLQ